ncbi:MAG: FG-GAP-like repeat-containing protein, partial [Planctomycetota bacterium]|nr:FG-GAP-like repeat-containing protein [Planctomycetota bacterium]
VATCRRRPNLIYFNDGQGSFERTSQFGTQEDSTIDVAIGDVNADGRNDLILANRDGQPNQILLNDPQTGWSKGVPYGTGKDQTRSVATGDFNQDGRLDWVTGNIGQPNEVFLGDGRGGVLRSAVFGDAEGRTYAVAVADLDRDGDLDIVSGNAGQFNVVHFNQGNGLVFVDVPFGNPVGLTYGIDLGDLDRDQYVDIVVANSDGPNAFYLNRPRPAEPPSQNGSPNPENSSRIPFQKKWNTQGDPTDWPSFRGLGGRGVSEGFVLPLKWNAKGPQAHPNVLWRVAVPGLGHSSPVVCGDQLFLLTAVASDGKAALEVESGGRPTAAQDQGEQTWWLLSYDKKTGKELWRNQVYRGAPKATRHAKATHANTTVTVSGDRVVVFLGSEGLYCFDREGKEYWKRDFGVIDISKYGIGWGYASSPAVHQGRIALVCDDPKHPFLVVLDLKNGRELWRTSRKGVSERNWSTPLIHRGTLSTQVVVNGWPWIKSYDLANGQELWRIKGGGDNPVPTPFAAKGWLYITSAHGGQAPIHVVAPSARGLL